MESCMSNNIFNRNPFPQKEKRMPEKSLKDVKSKVSRVSMTSIDSL
jgi:hypothetical protein